MTLSRINPTKAGVAKGLWLVTFLPLMFVSRMGHASAFAIIGLQLAIVAVLARLGGRNVVTQIGFVVGSLIVLGFSLYLHLSGGT
jgi:energy-coupling factor transporter transmembrane protein EcfT